MDEIRHDWSREEITAIYQTPLLELILQAADVHRRFHELGEVQISSLVSIKTGGCPEDCAYCPQAARYHTDIHVHGMMKVDEVLEKARKAKAAGASRMCLGAAWREVR
ncbi:MAG TPA: biotin synthase, partial [Anseongella sp.]|nr:biotin synthase [Anseongella sp.]